MLGTDKDTYEKMVSVFAIAQIPGLKMEVKFGQASFVWEKGFLSAMPMVQYEELEPIEVVTILEDDLYKNYDIPKRHYRNKFTGFKKTPFSSQN